MLTIERLTAEQATNALDDLIALLQDSVNSAASIGFLPPLSDDEARHYWHGIIDDLSHDTRVLLVARQEGAVVGSAQLDLPWKPNARHRAEVQKLIVHRSARRQGIGRKLMESIEVEARRAGLVLLVLDTRCGDPSEHLYRQIGFIEVGQIPQYARNGQGTLDPTVIYYKLLK